MYNPPQAPVAAAQLDRGDVVLFRFPLAEEGAETDAPKRRPCVVFDAFTWGRERFVELAYGTSVETRANTGQEVIVRHPSARATAGLAKPTRFVCARRIIVHVQNPGFHGRTQGPSVIGRLDASLMERMNALHARVRNEADIAADYCTRMQGEEQTREERGFR